MGLIRGGGVKITQDQYNQIIAAIEDINRQIYELRRDIEARESADLNRRIDGLHKELDREREKRGQNR